MKKRRIFVAGVVLLALVSFPPQWHPPSLKIYLANLVGAPAYRAALPSRDPVSFTPEEKCPEDLAGWRAAQTISEVEIAAVPGCVADNPYSVAAAVRGTNNVDAHVLMQSGFTPDAVEKGRDLDGDGDPDEIHIRLEVVELNGASPETDKGVMQYAIAPGIEPGFWVFAPKLVGMATENFESSRARTQLRLPSPSIRVEQGDRVQITLENTHYMPHTIHLHGVDHTFVDSSGEGNDGVPIASEKPVMPARQRTYELQPRHAGTMFYHCHVQPQVHVMMGLQGLFVIEENRPNNWLQTLNIGAGQLRHSSVAVKEQYDAEYDLHYLDIDRELNSRIRQSNDPRVITQSMHREYNITDARSDFYTLNGKSFPYTFRESLVVVEENQRVKLRVANGGSEGIALHTHGHKATITHLDGVQVPEQGQLQRDVIWIAGAQRADLALDTTNDGLNSYGPGIWLFHDHQQRAITTDGIAPGGHIAAIVYKSFLNDNGWPKTQGIGWEKFFSVEYYQRKIPVWESYALGGRFSSLDTQSVFWVRLFVFAICCGILLTVFLRKILGR